MKNTKTVQLLPVFTLDDFASLKTEGDLLQEVQRRKARVPKPTLRDFPETPKSADPMPT
jgi:hypothetical protein